MYKHRSIALTCATLFILFSQNLLFGQTYPIHITEEGHIVIQVTLVDSLKANFILDTGAGINVVSASVFDKIEKSATKKGYFTGFRHDGDRLDGPIFSIPAISLEGYRQRDVVIGIYPPLDDYGIDGLISLKFFEKQAFTIDFEQGLLKIIDNTLGIKKKDPLVLPISKKRHLDVSLDIFIPIVLNEEIQLRAEFDTGSGFGAFIINPNYIADLALDTTAVTFQPYITAISKLKRNDHIYSLKSIAVSDEEKKLEKSNVRAIFRDGLIYDALIGTELFRQGRITIDIPNGEFIIH